MGCEQRNDYECDVLWRGCLQWGYLEVGCQRQTNMSNMFTGRLQWGYLEVGCSVTNMNYMFYFADAFNGDISEWDVSSVTTMESCLGKRTFGKPLSGICSVTNEWDIGEANAFHGDIIWSSSVTNIYMFYRSTFNQDLSSWCVYKRAY